MNKKINQTEVVAPTRVREERNRDSGRVIWGVLLILSGLTFLLVNLGLAVPEVWGYIFRYWPVFIILGGFHVILGNGRLSETVLAVLTLAILGALFLNALVQSGSPVAQNLGISNWPIFNTLNNLKI